EEAAVADPRDDILGRQPERLQRVQRDGEDLGIREDIRLAQDVDVPLEMLPQTSALRPLVPEELRDREPADRLPEARRTGADHPRERRRHLRPQRHGTAALVLEVVELPHDLFAALLDVELERLERRTVVLLEPVAP